MRAMSIQACSRYSLRWHARRVPPTSPSIPSQSQVVATAAAAVLLLLSPGTAAARIPLELPPDYQERSQRDALRNLGTPAVTGGGSLGLDRVESRLSQPRLLVNFEVGLVQRPLPCNTCSIGQWAATGTPLKLPKA